MNVGALRNLIEGIPDDAEVRLMTQSSWPLEYDIAGTWTPAPQPDACGKCGWPEGAHDSGDPDIRHSFVDYEEDAYVPGEIGTRTVDSVVYIVEGRQIGYGTKTAWAETDTAW
jgi:hypothetical protein